GRTGLVHGGFPRARAWLREARPRLSRRAGAARLRLGVSTGAAGSSRTRAARRIHAFSGDGGIVERRTLSRGWIVSGVVALMAIGAGGVALSRSHRIAPTGTQSGVIAPEGSRIRVQVLNGTHIRGLARR